MIATTLASLALLAPVALDHPGKGRRVLVPTPVAVAVCDECGARFSTIDATIARLQRAPDDDDREDAAERLRGYNPRCHPEVTLALAESLGRDRDGGVRRESAESLTRLAARLPEAHLALDRAAATDPNPFVRHQAKKGLHAFSGRCVADCSVCGPVPTRGLAPVSVTVRRRPLPFVPTPIPRVREIVAPGVRIVIPGPTPFDDPPPAQVVEEPRLDPFDAPAPPEDVPPPRPVPAPLPSRSIRSTPASPAPADDAAALPPSTPVRRSSARPVFPPIETPTQVMPAPKPSPKPSAPPTDVPPLEGPAN